MMLVIKNAFLFIGAMIGAGFATGAELMIFFGDGSIWTVVLSGIITVILSYTFCLFGKIRHRYKAFDRVLSVVIFLSSIITFISMIGGANLIMLTGFGVPLMGLLSAIVVSILVIFNMDRIKVLNMIIMPIVIVMVIVFATQSNMALTSNSITFGKAVTYVGMNLLLAGFLLSDASAQMTNKQSLSCCMLIGIIITALIAIMLNLARQGSGAMPIIEFARGIGFNGLATVIVFLAILTTMIGAAKIIHDKSAQWLSRGVINARHKGASTIYMILLSIVCASCSFEMMVKVFYPITGYIGVAVCAMIVVMVSHNAVTNSSKVHFKKHKCNRTGE